MLVSSRTACQRWVYVLVLLLLPLFREGHYFEYCTLQFHESKLYSPPSLTHIGIQAPVGLQQSSTAILPTDSREERVSISVWTCRP